MVLGLLVASILLIRFTVDFFAEMPLLLAIPFALLVAAALAVAAINLWGVFKKDSVLPGGEGKPPAKASGAAQALLLASIPLGFLASTLDCSGLSWQGCTPFCTFIKIAWIPLIAVACAAYFFNRNSRLLVGISLMGFVTLKPHCLCFNVGNGWWIERIGASLVCYVWGFAVSLIALGAIKGGGRLWPSLLVNGAIIGGALTFFVSDHYFHFPR